MALRNSPDSCIKPAGKKITDIPPRVITHVLFMFLTFKELSSVGSVNKAWGASLLYSNIFWKNIIARERLSFFNFVTVDPQVDPRLFCIRSVTRINMERQQMIKRLRDILDEIDDKSTDNQYRDRSFRSVSKIIKQFDNLPQNFWFCLSKNLLPRFSDIGKDNKIGENHVRMMDKGFDPEARYSITSKNIAHLHRVFSTGYARVLLEDSDLDQSMIQEHLYWMLVGGVVKTLALWNHFFTSLENGKLFFSKENYKIFATIPKEFYGQVNPETFTQYLSDIKSGKSKEEALNIFFTDEMKNDKNKCLIS